VETVKNPAVPSIQDDINRLGAEGWELVSTVTTVKSWVNMTGNDLVLIFKRPGVGPYTERPEDEPGYVPYA
jgi:hypothetical protein